MSTHADKDGTLQRTDNKERATTITGHRNKDLFSPAFTAVVTAVGVGVNEMLSSGLTTGNAIGTAAGALGALVVTKAIDASVAEAAMIGGLAGGIGVAAGNKIDAQLSSNSSESGLLLSTKYHSLLEYPRSKG